MSLATLRTKIHARVAGVSNVGVVNDFEPYANREEIFRLYFKHASLEYVQGWTITRERSEEGGFALQANARAHLFVVRGYRVLADDGSSEKAFQDLIESVCDTLRVEQVARLDGAAQVECGPPAVRVVDVRRFSDFVVHYCEITLRVTELME